MIGYYVVRAGEQFEVKREGVSKGLHELEARALQAAKFMAAVEAAKFDTFAEVYLEVQRGRWLLMEAFCPSDFDSRASSDGARVAANAA